MHWNGLFRIIFHIPFKRWGLLCTRRKYGNINPRRQKLKLNESCRVGLSSCNSSIIESTSHIKHVVDLWSLYCIRLTFPPSCNLWGDGDINEFLSWFPIRMGDTTDFSNDAIDWMVVVVRKTCMKGSEALTEQPNRLHTSLFGATSSLISWQRTVLPGTSTDT